LINFYFSFYQWFVFCACFEKKYKNIYNTINVGTNCEYDLSQPCKKLVSGE